jgi:hypothetical protein
VTRGHCAPRETAAGIFRAAASRGAANASQSTPRRESVGTDSLVFRLEAAADTAKGPSGAKFFSGGESPVSASLPARKHAPQAREGVRARANI